MVSDSVKLAVGTLSVLPAPMPRKVDRVVAGLERKFGFSPRDFRLWLCLHEVAHRLQFGGAPWLRVSFAPVLRTERDI